MPTPRLDHLSDSRLWVLRPDAAARELLISRHLPMAHRLAARFRNANEPQEDLDQVAGMALVGAVDRFDDARGIPFAAFAVPTIVGEIKKHFRNTAWAVHVPRAAAERAQVVQRAQHALTDQIGRTPTVAELADFADLDLETTLEALATSGARYATSLDEPLAHSGEDPVDLVQSLGECDGGYDLVDARLSLGPALRGLPLSERRALTLRVEEGLTQSEIGGRLGCSQMQVSRLLGRATQRLSAQLQGGIWEDVAVASA